MKLSLSDVARRMNVPEGTIERWLRQGRIPTRRRRGEYVFDLKEIESWAKTNRFEFQSSPEDLREQVREPELPTLSQAVQRGGVHNKLRGQDTETVLREVVGKAPLVPEQAAIVIDHVLQREQLASTGIGHGVAVPHPRNPVLEPTSEAIVTVGFLDQPVDFAAVDGLPVFVLFLILSPGVKVHLHLLGRLAFFLSNEDFVEFLRTQPSSDELLRQIRALEQATQAAASP